MDDERGIAPLAGLSGVGKSYGGVPAVKQVDFTVHQGEVHALLGENGAGKSTLMKILAGEIADYRGELRIDGELVKFTRPLDARRAGIAMIHQELDLVPALSVAENVFLGREPRTRFGTVDRRRMLRETQALLTRIGVGIDAGRAVERLRTGERQVVTIACALGLDARVLIMDEPTSALSAREVDQLFGVIGELRSRGAGVVYISHRMEEIGRVADRATVLRNGEVVAEFDARAMTAEQASTAMVGRPVEQMFRAGAKSVQAGEDVLVVEDLAVVRRRPRPGRREPAGISLRVGKGEIVGLAGLLGAGRTELLEALYGLTAGAPTRGRVVLNGVAVKPRGPRQAMKLGIAYVPEDRRTEGLALERSVLANTVLSVVGSIAKAGVVSGASERRVAKETVDRLGVKLRSLADPVGTLSGGNQQKIVLGRGLTTGPSLLLLDEPTRGVDVGAKAEIYRLLGETAARGIGILLASSEPAELVGVCDRVVVLHGGRSVRELDTAEAGEADLLAATMSEGLGEAL